MPTNIQAAYNEVLGSVNLAMLLQAVLDLGNMLDFEPKTSLNKGQVSKLFQVCISTTASLSESGVRKRSTRSGSRVLEYVIASYNQSVEAKQARTGKLLPSSTAFEYRVKTAVC